MKHKCTWMCTLELTTFTKELLGLQNFGVIHNDSRLKDMWFVINMQLIWPKLLDIWIM